MIVSHLYQPLNNCGFTKGIVNQLVNIVVVCYGGYTKIINIIHKSFAQQATMIFSSFTFGLCHGQKDCCVKT